jgi:tetratricopeptide (TPR) repeat protein
LCSKDLKGLCATLKRHWTEKQILCLLKGAHADARKVAALALGLLGDQHCIDALAEQLADEDPMVNQMAEHALWSIWFRMGSDCANREILRGLDQLNRREFDQAVLHFSRAIERDPQFAEAYNQRAIAHYLKEEYEESAQDCRQTVSLMQCHFGAWAGLAHCYAHLHRLSEAIECYERALEINPHLSCVRDAVEELRAGAN